MTQETVSEAFEGKNHRKYLKNESNSHQITVLRILCQQGNVKNLDFLNKI
jgi:hypothetical protein